MEVMVRRKRPKLPRVASNTLHDRLKEPFSMPRLPSKTSTSSKSAPGLRKEEAKPGYLPMLSPTGGRGPPSKARASTRVQSLPAVHDLRIQAMSLCKRHQMSFPEIMAVLEAVQSLADKTSIPMDQFRTFMQRALYVENINDDLVQSAYKSCVSQGCVNVDEFLNWCKAHMFSVVAGLTADSQHTSSVRLVQSIAHRHGLRVSEVDRMYSHFQKFDVDKSGQIEFGEFEGMIKSLIGVSQATELPKERLVRFWKEMDSDGNGIVDFNEFSQWYIKYFPISTKVSDQSGGVLEAFYASFSPDVQRSKSLDEQSQEEIMIRQEAVMAREASWSNSKHKKTLR